MKSLCFSVALYLAALSAYPCYDGGCADEHSTEAASENEEQEVCSPFCLSVCCALQVKPTGFQQPLREFIQVHPPVLYKEPFVATVIQSIWQPPRLS